MFSRNSVFLCLAVLVACASAFAPADRTTTYAPMKRVSGYAAPPPSFSRNQRCKNGACYMSSDPEAEAAKLREQAQKLREEAAEAAGVSVEELTASLKNADGTIYDDEILEPPRENVSNAMKERLTREASSGLDSSTGNTNVILYISAVVVVLVALAGGGNSLLNNVHV